MTGSTPVLASAMAEDILEFVIPFLSLVDRFHVGLACRRWRSIVHSVSKFYPPPPALPSLLHIKGDSTGHYVNLIDPISGAELTLRIPGLEDAIVVSSRDEWLLLSRRRDSRTLSLFFLNPLTRERVDLPDLQGTSSEGGFSFSEAPTSSSCVVVGINDTFENDVFLYLCYRGDQAWSADVRPCGRFGLGFLTNPTFYKGSCYCMATDGFLGVFDLQSYAWTLLQPALPTTTPDDQQIDACSINSNPKQYLLEFEGDLLRVIDLGCSALVLKLSPSMDQWVVLEDLTETSLFLSGQMSSAFTGDGGGCHKKGLIYFNRVQQKGCVAYAHGSDSSVSKKLLGFQKYKEFLFSAWVKLDWSKHPPEELQWHEG